MKQQSNSYLSEGMKPGDLDTFVSEIFTIDKFKSKMGEDEDISVIAFRVKDKNVAIDLMEFIEKGYEFVLDADMSSGEEYDGQYQVFVELKRTNKLFEEINKLLLGVTRLTNIEDWQFKYYTLPEKLIFNEENLKKHVPTTLQEYQNKLLSIKNKDIKEVLNQGSADINLESDNTLTFSKPYAGDLKTKFIAIGDYETVKNSLPGKLSLDESSQSEIFFLTKYLGNYEIDKIGNKFLIKNGDKAIIIEKNRW
jgi:hypothetical protein